MTDDRPVEEIIAPSMVLPGKDYGVFGELIPICRSVNALIEALDDVRMGAAVLKYIPDITDSDSCQRGPDGKPLPRVTPGVPFLTFGEWQERGKK